MDEANEPRPSCNCKTSLCVRRYCPCFGSGWYCSDACRCESCCNTETREAFVEERAEMSRKGKPSASSQSKGCTCRKSECKKNYCECFKNRAACTERCQCQGCANTHGSKGGTTLLHNNGDSGGTSGDSDGTPDDSDGTSDDTAAIITDEGSPSLTEAELEEILEGLVEPSDIGQHVCAPSFAFYDSLADQDCFSQNAHAPMHQGSVQALLHGSANSTPRGLLDPNVNSGSQEGPSGN